MKTENLVITQKTCQKPIYMLLAEMHHLSKFWENSEKKVLRPSRVTTCHEKQQKNIFGVSDPLICNHDSGYWAMVNIIVTFQ